MSREVRLVSARDWLRAAGPVRTGDYAARYGADQYVAHQEMLRLGAIADGVRKYAMRPASVPKRRRPRPEDEALKPFVIEFGGVLLARIGHTAGGVPYGLMGEELEELLWDFEADRPR